MMNNAIASALQTAQQYIEQENYQEAAKLSLAVIQSAPQDAEGYAIMGIIYYKIQGFDEAKKFLDNALTLNPEHAKALLYRGYIASAGGYPEDAYTYMAKAWQVDQNDPDICYQYLHFMERFGEQEKFEELMETALDKHKGCFKIQLQGAVMRRRQKRYEDALALLENIPEEEEALLLVAAYFERGKICDALEKIDEAYEAFEKSNFLKKRYLEITNNFPDNDNFPLTVRMLRTAVERKREKDWDIPPPDNQWQPHFLVGWPRSGTTLLQQMLDAHPTICCSDEISSTLRVREKLLDILGGNYERLAELNAREVESLRKVYRDEVITTTDFKPNLTFVDKNPLNLVDIPILYYLFPDSRYILAMRHPCDAILSCFMQNFSGNDAMIHMLNLDDAVNLYVQVMEMFRITREILPVKIHTTKYEDVVENQENEARKILEFMNTPWDESVLKYRKKKKEKHLISTPSYQQVSEPIYKTAAGRWKRYEKYLAPYLSKLKPYIEEFGYEE